MYAIRSYYVTKVINTSDFDMDPGQFSSQGTAVLNAALALARQLEPEISHSLMERAEGAQQELLVSLLALGLVVLVLAWLMVA